MELKKLLGRSTFMMSLALIVALGLGLTGNFPSIAANVRSDITIVVLAIMMTVALSRIPFSGLNPLSNRRSVGRAMLLGIVVAAAVPFIASFFFIGTPYQLGLVIISVAPFASSVVPLSYILRGDLEHAARGTLVVYVLSIVYIPIVVYLTLGARINVLSVLLTVIEVVLLPLILSRLLVKVKIDRDYMAIFLNSCIFILVFLSVGASAGMFSSEIWLLVMFMGIAFLRTFCIGNVLEAAEKHAGIPWGQRVTDVLMASYKNKGIAIALVTAIATSSGLNIGAALFPVTASIVIEVCWVIFMDSVLFSPKRMKAETGISE
jgi:BASS family bile acid:Na+ symporter